MATILTRHKVATLLMASQLAVAAVETSMPSRQSWYAIYSNTVCECKCVWFNYDFVEPRGVFGSNREYSLVVLSGGYPNMPPKRPRGIPDRANKKKPRENPPDAARDTRGSREESLLQLCNVLGTQAAQIMSIRRQNDKFSLIDVAMLVTNNSREHAGHRIEELFSQHPEVCRKTTNFKFKGRGQRDTPVGDIYVVVEMVMLLPGKRAASVRSECARLFVQTYGGDLSLANEIINNRKWQEELAESSPEHPARALGERVEATSEVVSTTEIVTKTCEIAIRSLLPTMLEKISAFFVAKFKEFELDRDRQQQDLLQKLESMTSKRQFVNVNCSSRNNADLDVINLEAPRTVQDSERIKGMFLPVSKFLREMWIFC